MAVVLGNSGNNTLNGTADADVILGNGGADIIDAGGGADTIITGSGGDDTVTGGAGVDTLVLAGSFDNYTATVADGKVIITDGVTTTTVSGVEIVVFDDKVVRLVGAEVGSEYETIQSAIDAGGDGEAIAVAPGAYDEQIVIEGKTDLAIAGLSGEGAVTIRNPGALAQTATSNSGREVHAIVTVESSTNVTFENINVDGLGSTAGISGSNPNFVGVYYKDSSGGLEDVNVTGIRDPLEGGSVSGLQRGVGVQADNLDTGPRLDFSMTGGSITDYQKNGTVFTHANINITGVTVTGSGAQSIIAQNGIQVAGSTGTVSGNTVTGIGYAGPAFAYSGAILLFNNTDLDVINNTVAGTNDEDADSKVVGIFLFDYDGEFSSGGSISGNTVSKVDTGIGIYGNITPDNIAVSNNTVSDIDITDPFAAGVEFAPNANFDVSYTVEGSALADKLNGTEAADTLTGLDGDDVLEGNGGADILSGGAGADTLIGGAGADTLSGGAGNDFYSVDNVLDTVIELAGEGVDTVESSVTYTLAANVENLTLVGSADINGTGNAGVNVITGNSGNNVLNGGAGIDTLIGGAGNDTYVVGAAGETIIELEGEGVDTVQAFVGLTLGANVENLQLLGTVAITGTGNGLANVITGNGNNNVLSGGAGSDTLDGGIGDDNLDGGTESDILFGGAGNDTLNGGAGNDTMTGGSGNDSYIVGSSGDVVVELAGGGTDKVTSYVNYTLGNNVENLTLAGGAVSGTGNSLANTIIGTGGANTLNGGAGADTLTGGAGADSFLFNSLIDGANIDFITDFNVAADTIHLDDAVFDGLMLGTLDVNAFTTGAAASDAADRIIYNASTGALFYDADGSGESGQVQFATVSSSLALTNLDFNVV